MKKTITLFLLVGLYANIFAQIPNNDFESWTNDGAGNINPDFWLSPNDSTNGYVPIVQATGYMGTYAMRVYTPTVASVIVPGATIMQFPSTLRPGTLNGYYKGIWAANDSSYITFTSTLNGTGIGAGVMYASIDQPSFTYFSIPIYYGSGSNPDTISIIVSSGTQVITPGADITIDELTFSMTAGIEIPVSSALINGGHMDSDLQNYLFYINSYSPNDYTIKLFDIAGHEVFTSFNHLAEGKYPITLPANSLVNGIYVLRVIGGQTNYAQKIIITH